MDKSLKVIAAITALLVALGGVLGTVTMTIGKSDAPVPAMTIILSSPEQYADFIKNHPSSG